MDLKGLLSAGTLSQRKTFLRSFVKLIRKKGNTIETESWCSMASPDLLDPHQWNS